MRTTPTSTRLARISLITAVLTALSVASAHAYSADVYRVCNLDPDGDNFLALRAGPTANHRMIMRLPPDTKVEDWGSRGRWMEVDVLLDDRPSGWVYASFLCLYEDH